MRRLNGAGFGIGIRRRWPGTLGLVQAGGVCGCPRCARVGPWGESVLFGMTHRAKTIPPRGTEACLTDGEGI